VKEAKQKLMGAKPKQLTKGTPSGFADDGFI